MQTFTLSDLGVFLGVLGGILTTLLLTIQKSKCNVSTSSVAVVSATVTGLNPMLPRKSKSNPIRENVTMSDPTLKAPNQEKPTRPIQYKRA